MTSTNETVPHVDWRRRVATTVEGDHGPGEPKYPEGSVLTRDTAVQHKGREIFFGDPSATALFLNQSHEAYVKAMAVHPFHGQWPPSDESPSSRVFDYLETIIASIVFAYTALEAFVNEELPEDFVWEVEIERPDGLFFEVHQYDKGQIERSISLSEKLASILPKALDKASPKGQKPWEGFVHLRRLRDRVVHLKSQDRRHSKAWDMFPESIWSDLLDPEQRDYPSIAKSMMLHFKEGEEPWWLKHCPF